MLACFLVSGSVQASNLAFGLTLNLPPTTANLSFLALPYVYAPATAEQLCQDLGGSTKVAAVQRWDEPTSRFVSYTCGSGSGFSLAGGVAYGVRNATGQTISTLLVGAHDDGFSFSLAPTSTSNLSWVSLPYHQAIPDVGGVPGEVDAEDLCQSVGSDTVFAVVRFDSTASAYLAYSCSSAFETPFALDLAEGYGLVNAEGQTISWQPPHF